MPDQPKDVTIAFLTAGAEGRADDAIALLADDCEFWYTGAGQVGRDEFLAGMRGLIAATNPGHLTVRDIIEEAGRVAIEYTGHIPLKNGKVYANTYHTKMVVSDGKITAMREYLDPLIVMDAFGAINAAEG